MAAGDISSCPPPRGGPAHLRVSLAVASFVRTATSSEQILIVSERRPRTHSWCGGESAQQVYELAHVSGGLGTCFAEVRRPGLHHEHALQRQRFTTLTAGPRDVGLSKMVRSCGMSIVSTGGAAGRRARRPGRSGSVRASLAAGTCISSRLAHPRKPKG